MDAVALSASIALAVLNIALAIVVASPRPARRGNLAVAALCLVNGLIVLEVPVLGPVSPELLLIEASISLLLLIPAWWPTRVLSPRGDALLTIVAAALPLTEMLIEIVPTPPIVHTIIQQIPLHVALSIGALAFLWRYQKAPTSTQREQARFFLAAYAMSAAALGLGVDDALGVLLSGMTALTILAIAASLAISRVAGRGGDRRVGGDLFVYACILAGFALSITGQELGRLAYLLARPILLAYGVLRFRLLDVSAVDRSAVAVVVISALAATFLTTAGVLQANDAPIILVVGAPLLLVALLALMLVSPVLARTISHGREEAASIDIYRAALEQVVLSETGSPGSSDSRVLGALRERLRLSERQHALLDAEVRAALGRAQGGLAVGARFLGRYRIEAPLGEGGFGRAYRAHDESVGREVVLKVSHAEGADAARRAAREARVIARLAHPNIITLYDVEEIGTEVVLVLEYAAGGSLESRLAERGQLSEPEALAIARDVLAALKAAHAAGIVHRDVKPANILLSADGRAKLADFGVARVESGSGTASGMSFEGDQPGSLRYMSPEQVRGAAVDARGDVYSAAVVLYEALAGRPYLPLKGRAGFDARLAIIEQKPELPLENVSARVNAALAAALAKDAGERVRSADEFAKLLGLT